MRILVTGGSGFLGINLIRFLLARGHEIRSWDIAPFDYPERDRIDELHGDIRDLSLHERGFAGIDAVVHCAAALPLCSEEEIFSTDVGGTKLLLRSAEDKGIARFVHISSTAVYGVPDHHPLFEHDPMVGVGPYGSAKIEAERAIDAFRARGLTVPVLRPKSFVGPERLGAFELLYDFAVTGHGFPVLGNGQNLYQLLDVDDLCQAIWLCLSASSERVNDTFNVGAGRFGTLRQGFQAVLDQAGFGKHVVGFPLAPAVATLRALEALHLSPLYKWIYETAGKDSFVSIDKIGDRTGFVPQYSNEDALLRNFDWYVANRGRISAKAGVSHRVPWKKGALGLVKLVI